MKRLMRWRRSWRTSSRVALRYRILTGSEINTTPTTLTKLTILRKSACLGFLSLKIKCRARFIRHTLELRRTIILIWTFPKSRTQRTFSVREGARLEALETWISLIPTIWRWSTLQVYHPELTTIGHSTTTSHILFLTNLRRTREL